MGEEDCVPLRGLPQHVVLVMVREGDRCLNTDVVLLHSENMQANVSLRVSYYNYCDKLCYFCKRQIWDCSFYRFRLAISPVFNDIWVPETS